MSHTRSAHVVAEASGLDIAAAYVALGSNLGDREATVLRALRMMEASDAVRVIRVSALYETEPVGMGPTRAFINAVAQVEPLLPPGDLLIRMKDIERRAGRRTGHNAPRVIDLDLIAYGDHRIDTPVLRLPHPRYAQRGFVLAPLADVSPDFVCPATGAHIGDMIDATGLAGVRLISSRSFRNGPRQ